MGPASVGPQRIVCLTEETVETRDLLGAEARSVGVTGYAVRPTRVRRGQAAADRIARPAEVVAAVPDLILASWCGKKVRPEKIAARPGWDTIPALRTGRMVEIKSPLILQPGPAALTDGLDAILAALAG